MLFSQNFQKCFVHTTFYIYIFMIHVSFEKRFDMNQCTSSKGHFSHISFLYEDIIYITCCFCFFVGQCFEPKVIIINLIKSCIFEYSWILICQSVVVNSNPVHGKVHSIQHYVIKFVRGTDKIIQNKPQ